MAAVYFAILLLENLHYFGILLLAPIGLSAFMGINHGLYTFFIFLLLLFLFG